MNREEFLKNHWKSYPSFLNTDRQLIYGRINKIHNNYLELVFNGEATQVQFDNLVETDDEYYGASIPATFLNIGDSVLFKNQSFYLLSPNFNNSWRFDSQSADWSQFLNSVTDFFEDNDFVSIKTPFLVTSPGVDHHIDFMEVKAVNTQRKWTLPTSPEISLKKHLCLGYDNIFEIKSCFRDDLPGPDHSAEFTMLEWYRTFSDLDAIQEDLHSLLTVLSGKELELKVRSVAQCFKDELNFELTPETSLGLLKELADKVGIEISAGDDWNDAFFRIFMERIEPKLGVGGPEIITQFPPQQASLAQIDSSGWAARFEIYWSGVELGNAYLEVNDPSENRSRFLEESKKRSQKGVSLAPMDEEFFEYLQNGMPPSAGIAMGMDRLFRLLKTNA